MKAAPTVTLLPGRQPARTGVSGPYTVALMDATGLENAKKLIRMAYENTASLRDVILTPAVIRNSIPYI